MKLVKILLRTGILLGYALLFLNLACSPENSVATDVQPFQEPQIEFAPKHYVCFQTDVPLKIDGKLTDAAWKKAAWTDYFIDIEGNLKPGPLFKTHAKMLWDEKYFYVAAELEEPHIWATLKKHDSIIFYDNDFEVFIDPDGDTHRYYELELNAFSTAWDLFLDRPYRDNGQALFSWDIRGLKKAVHINGTINNPADTDQSWTVEIAIPWAVLKECAPDGRGPLPGEQWRVGFSRVEWQVEVKDGKYSKVKNPKTGKHLPENNWIWSPQGLINMHYPEMWGFVQFSGKIAGGEQEEFKPNPDEMAKWALRQVYYRERSFYNQNKKYTCDISALNLQQKTVAGYLWPPEIKHTWNQFEARLQKEGGKGGWYINQDGYVWEK